MSTHAAGSRGGRAVANRSVYRKVEASRARKRRQPTADLETPTLVQSSSAPSLPVAASVASLPLHGERALMATICAIVANTPTAGSSSSASPSSSPTPSHCAVTPAVVLSAPSGWMDRTSKRSKTPVLASPWSGHSHTSIGDWMPHQDGASPASSTSSAAHNFYPMHRRSSLPCFPFPASNFPNTPTSGSSAFSSSSLHSFPPMPAGPSRLQSAPSAIRCLSQHARSERAGIVTPPLEEGNEAAATAGANKFENLQLRLAAHPAIRRLQQLDEAQDDERQASLNEEEEEEEEEDNDDHEERNAEQDDLSAHQQDGPSPQESPMMPVHAEVLSALPVNGLPVVDEAEHAPLAGLVAAFPFVQQFMPQPTRAEKKKKFIERIHASHQLTIPNNYSPTPAILTRQMQVPVEEYPSPPLPAALPAAFRSTSTSSAFSSDDSQEDVSSDNGSCSHTDCSSSALADTFASLSPNSNAQSSSFFSQLPPPTFFLTPVLGSSSSSSSSTPFPSHILPSPAFHHALPPVFTSPAMLSSTHSSLGPDELQLGEPAWAADDGQWMGDW